MNPAIKQAIFGVSGIVIVSKLFGFLREMVIAERYGTSQEYDIFLLAISAPVFFQLVVMRATNFLTVPILSKRLSASTENTEQYNIRSMFNSLMLIVLILVAGVVLFAPFLVKMMDPDLTGENLDRGIFYCRAISLTILLGFLESFLRSALNVRKQFAYPATGTIILNIVIIAAIYLFSSQMSVAAILMGMVIGLSLQVIFLLLKLWNYDYVKYFNLRLFDKQVRNTLAIGGIIVLVELLMTTFFLIDRYFASELAEGVVASLKYAGILVILPVSIVGFTIAAVTFPYLSERAEGNTTKEFASLVRSSLSLALVIGLPCGIFYLAFSEELIAAVFFRGAFDLVSLEMTSRILIVYAPYLVCLFLYTILIQICYSSGRQKIVFYVSLLAVVVKFVLTWLLKTIFDYPGIALATSVVHIMIFIILVSFLAKRHLIDGLRILLVTTGRVLIAAAPILVVGYFCRLLPDFSAETDLLSKLRIIPVAIMSLLFFIVIGYIMKISEIRSFLADIKKWFA